MTAANAHVAGSTGYEGSQPVMGQASNSKITRDALAKDIVVDRVEGSGNVKSN
jgi:hypothetical protein